MPSLTIRNIPDELMDDLRSQAKTERRSLNSQALWCLEYGLTANRDLARRARTVKSIGKLREAIYQRHGVLPDSTGLIRKMRDERAKTQR